MRTTETLCFRFIVAMGFLLLFGISMLVSSAAPKRISVAPPEIEAEGGDDILETTEIIQTTGTYFFNPYSAGNTATTFSLHIQAVTLGHLKSEKKIIVETKGDSPSPCPARPVWMPPQSKRKVEVLAEYSLGDLIRHSSLIFAGRVVHIEFCQASKSSIPFTFVTFSELRIIHGTYRASELTVAFAGGVIDDTVSEFVHMPKFNRGERFLLFLTARPDYRLTPTVGWQDGVFLSEKDGIKNYNGQPVIGIDQKDRRLVIATDAEPQIRPIDPVYGSHKVIESPGSKKRAGPPGREPVPAPVKGTAMSEKQFATGLGWLIRTMGVPTPGEGRLLKPGSPFQLKPIRGVAPPKPYPAKSNPLKDSRNRTDRASALNNTFTSAFEGGAGNAYGAVAYQCLGDIMKWTSNSAVMKRSLISFPSGLPFTNVLIASENKWNEVPGHSFSFVDETDNDNTIELGGDGNEVGFVLPEDTDGAAGLTSVRYRRCDDRPGHNMPIVEADILFNVAPVLPDGRVIPWSSGVPDPRAFPDPLKGEVAFFRSVAVHELGHALGLSPGNHHEDRSIATMNSRYPAGGWYPGNPSDRVIPHGDDRAGIRFIYPGSLAPEIDIAVLNFVKLGTLSLERAGLVNSPTAARVCPGHEITIQYNFGNIGTESVDFNLGFYLSTDVDISTSDILVASERWLSGTGLGSYGPGVLSRTLTIAGSVSFDTEYFVGVFADFDEAMTEANETNNRVALPGSIRIPPQTTCAQTELTVKNVLVPSNDPGLFNLQIDGITRATNVGHGGSTAPQVVSIGTHTVGETAGTDTHLDYYTIRIGGDCAPDGSITLGGGDVKTCTITNSDSLCKEWQRECLDLAVTQPESGMTPNKCYQSYQWCLRNK